MRRKFARARLLALAAAVVAIQSPHTHAQAYPTKPIRIIVPTSPPGGADVVARSTAPALTERLGQQVFIDNRAGASTMLGGEIASKAPPDGYTLLLGISTLAINPATFRKVPYDALRDFVPITHAAQQPLRAGGASVVPGENRQGADRDRQGHVRAKCSTHRRASAPIRRWAWSCFSS